MRTAAPTLRGSPLALVAAAIVAALGCGAELTTNSSGDASGSGGSSTSGGGGSTSSGASSGGGSGDAGASSGASSSGTSGGTSSTSGASSGGTVGHPRRVLLGDEGNGRVLLVDLETGRALWSRALEGPRDLQLVGGDRVAASTAKGYVELDLGTGEVRKEVRSFQGVESLRRLPDGHTVLGANSSGGVTLVELDAQDAPVAGRQVTFGSYGQLRLLRRTPRGTFLMGVGSKVAEVDWSRQTAWEMDVPGGSSVYQALRLVDGTVAVSSGYGAAILVLDPVARSVRTTIGGKAQPGAAAVVPSFYAGFQILPNGHFVVTNWEGHGGGNGGKGLQLLEYDAAGLLVWSWKQDPDLVSSLHDVIVLDGLDTALLHDDVDGVLAPVTR